MRYAIITPARNEERHIPLTLESMVRQSCPPVRWVVVSDGSTDRTDEIVGEAVRGTEWIELVRLPEDHARTFAAKVHAFNAGMQRLRDLEYDVVGNLDADISFEPDYFEFLMAKFADNPRLGVAGTPFVEDGSHYDYRFTNIEHVSGACQLFRRECFAEIGGYTPIEGGGIDWTAVTTARMRGWQTRTFPERTCTHHRPLGSASSKGQLRAAFRHGRKDYALGSHPLWQVFRGAYQMTRRPYITGGAALLVGYAWALVTRHRRPIPDELVHFTQAEQLTRLKAAVFRGGRRG